MPPSRRESGIASSGGPGSTSGAREQVTRVGDYFTAAVGDVPIVVVRNEDGLSGFVNVCRHRRHEVVSGSGNRKVLQCPYHAWTYGLDGCLRAAPRSDHEPGFDRASLPLLPVSVDTWGPFVFANLEAAAPLSRVLGELPAIVGRSGLRLDDLRFSGREEWTAGANWKVMIENFLECYHCPVQHPGFSAVVDVAEESYGLHAHEWFSSQVRPGARLSARGSGTKGGLRRPRGRDPGAVPLSLAEPHRSASIRVIRTCPSTYGCPMGRTGRGDSRSTTSAPTCPTARAGTSSNSTARSAARTTP